MTFDKAAKRSSCPDVLIAGARTTGLMLAIRLRRQGLSVRIVDSSPGIDPHSRATLLHSRTLELLQGMGLADEIVAGGQVLRGMRLFAEGRQVMETCNPAVESPFPYGIVYAQNKIETVLERRLADLGVAVERDTALIGLEQEAEGVSARLRRPDGSEEGASASWLVGCDGAHSAVRKLLDIALKGDGSPQRYILADVMVGNDEPSDRFFYFLHDEGDLFIAVLDEGRRLVFATLPLDHQGEGAPDLAEVQTIVDRRSGGSYPLSDPRWLTYFRIHYCVAERYRVGRVFLAGDAAHLNSLLGGHGMNTGIQDACNLAWKLALAAKGLASEALLDSYEAERRPVAVEMVATTKGWTEPGEAFPRLSPSERTALLEGFKNSPEEAAALGRSFEELDLDYGASPLSREGDAGLPSDLRPGLEARNVPGLYRDGEPSSLFELVAGPNHALLVFPVSESDLRAADVTARTVAERHGDWIDPYLVCREPVSAAGGDAPACLLDTGGSLRQRYGMQGGGIYLVRPDGYIAYRSRKAGGLDGYIQEVFGAP